MPALPSVLEPDLGKMPSFDETNKPDPSISINALDEMFKAAGGDPKRPEEPLAKLEVDEDASAPPAKEEKPPAKEEKPPVKAEEKKEKPPVKEEKPEASTSDVLDDAEKAAIAADKLEKSEKVEKLTVPPPVVENKDEFDAVELPTNTKPKTGESFNQLKTLARERVAAVTKEKDALAKQVEELKTKVTEGLPKEIETELKTLREFRAKLDVESDPAFSSYDKTVAENIESIYAKLKATPGIDDKQIEAIKNMGGPLELDWDGPGITLPGQVRRFISAKLVEIESLTEKKNKAIADAKSNAEQYLSTRREEQTRSVEQQNKAVEKEIEAMLPNFKWFAELKAKDGASAEEKAAIDAHNKVIADSTATFKDAVTDNSPVMRAVLAVGYAQLLKTRADYSAFKATATAKEAAAAEKEKALTKELEDTKTLLAKIKKSSTTRLRDTPAEDESAGKSKSVDYNTPATDALDKHLAAIQAYKE